MNSATLAPSQSREQRSLVIAALGVVFGDIGTSPLYTIKECFSGAHALEPTPENILGILSLIFWSVLIIISLKYVTFIMKADNKGEGGIMALISLIQQKAAIDNRFRFLLIGLGLIGASLFYGDGMITPAISVLSAVEGLEVFQPELHVYVIPIALAILIGLFAFQRRGTANVGALFGPIMLVWFGSLAIFGTLSLIKTPEVLAAVNPIHAIHFFATHGWPSFLVLGAVVLAVTGGEALYADMGHFGRDPIRKAWFLLVLPSLMLNYFGQGALLIQTPTAVQNPFYLLVPGGALAFMIGLATVATIVASQAVISGAFSLTAQAVQLGFCPRLGIQYTSEDEMGQIYIPWINWALMLGIVGLILGFQSSSNLAAAYGIAVTGTMAIDTILAFVVVYSLWKWNLFVSGLLALGFLTIDLAFLTANATKIFEGGWFPLVIGLAVFTLLTTWKRGRNLLADNLREDSVPVDRFLGEIAENPPVRVAGTAVFMTSNREGIPPALLHNLKHNKVLHETTVLMTVTTENVPRVVPEKRREIRGLGSGFFRINLHYGFMETPNIPRVLKSCSRDFDIDISDTTFFLNRETIIPAPRPRMALWRLKLFIGMSRNTSSAVGFFRIPPDRVVELGVQLML
ncbi:potassium transporter Kup [Methylocaldum sp.]|uniref:potassium transporter Kup n=1 Tax=Methylocaldum sp. TaxID=1969727 RepID=UPI002D50D973|nr:potassium transporter Kup [Methylocaldum sp.]HYE37170.1 potassium transporter Kup [Methylocaldum sp.]